MMRFTLKMKEHEESKSQKCNKIASIATIKLLTDAKNCKKSTKWLRRKITSLSIPSRQTLLENRLLHRVQGMKSGTLTRSGIRKCRNLMTKIKYIQS